MIILLGLTSLRHKHVRLNDVHLFCQSWPLAALFGILCESGGWPLDGPHLWCALPTPGYDLSPPLLTPAILLGFGGFESPLMILMAALGQAFMLHSCDLVTFYGCSELQNFGFLVLCALQPGRESSGFSVEASLKISLLSAFSSGVCLFLFSVIYARTGQSVLLDAGVSAFEAGADSLSTLGVLLALLFKHGTAPMHLWMVDIYQSIKKPLLMILSTAPKLSMFCFWVSALHNIWTDASIGVFVCFSMILGSLGAYGQPALRSLFAYSTIVRVGFETLWGAYRWTGL
jgi:NADH:ubiquinone oxidoreductase subunit 2 (subunit N)